MSKHRNTDTERLAAMLKALASPQRLRVFMKLTRCCEPDGACGLTREGLRRCVGDLARELDLVPSTVSHHLRELRLAGVMNMERCGKRIECWISEDALGLLADFFSEARSVAGCREDRTACICEGGPDGTQEP
jgi:ArsR family transcriptional regulator